MLAGLKKAWLEEPILTRVTPALVALAAYLIAKYVADAQLADLILGVVVVLVGGTGALSARAVVAPLAKLGRHRAEE